MILFCHKFASKYLLHAPDILWFFLVEEKKIHLENFGIISWDI